MKKFLVKTVAASGFVAALALVGFAQQPTQTAPVKEGGHHGHHGERGMHEMFENLNLSDAQKQQIASIRAKYRTINQPLFEEARALKKQEKQGATLTADQQARLQTLHEQLKASEKQERQEIIAVLTPDQQAQLKAKMQERWAHKRGNGAFGENKQPNQ